MSKKPLKNMYFKEPETLEDALEVVTTISLFLDLWIGKQDEWLFVQLLTKSVDNDIWKVVAKCVVTKSGLSLSDVKFEELKTIGVLEALTVFSNGIMDMDIPDIYLQNCAGITTSATLALIKDANRIKEELKDLDNPTKLVSHLISRIVASSL